MQSAIVHLGGDAWIPRREAWLTAAMFWVAGFAVAGAAAWHAQHPVLSSYVVHAAAAAGDVSSVRAPEGDTNDTTGAGDAPDTAASPAVIVMPQDIIVAAPARRGGNTQMQKP